MTLPRTGAGPSAGGCSYLLRATFDAANQDFADEQVLDTLAEGVQAGQLTVVEVDGTLAIASNKCAFTAQATPAWGDLGFYSQAITKALGLTLLYSINLTATTSREIISFQNAASVALLNTFGFFFKTAADLAVRVVNVTSPALATYSSATDYQLAIVLGGYDVNGVPWRSGQTPASYLYGAAFYIKGGAFTDWTLLWRTSENNTNPLYAALSNYDAAGTLDDFRVPDRDYSAVLQPAALSTFDAANGTSLHAITPEVGGSWTEQSGNWDIQGNQANTADNNAYAAVQSSVADVLVDCVVAVQANSTNDGYGLFIRSTDSNNGWKITISDFDNVLELIERDAGSDTLRASTGIAIALNTDYDLRAIADAQTIDAFLDGANKITYASASFNETATKHGIYTRGGSYGRLDNFAVYDRTSAVYETELEAC